MEEGGNHLSALNAFCPLVGKGFFTHLTIKTCLQMLSCIAVWRWFSSKTRMTRNLFLSDADSDCN